MKSFFYKNYFSDWFLYYILTISYGFFLNIVSPFIVGPYSLIERIYYFFGLVLGIVSFLLVPLGIRKKNLIRQDNYKTSRPVFVVGILLIIISIFINIISTYLIIIYP